MRGADIMISLRVQGSAKPSGVDARSSDRPLLDAEVAAHSSSGAVDSLPTRVDHRFAQNGEEGIRVELADLLG